MVPNLSSLEWNWIALVVLLLGIFVSVYSRNQANRTPTMTGKRIRRIYRESWVEYFVRKKNAEVMVEVVRNNVIVSTALMSAVIIAFGFVLNGYVASDSTLFNDFRIMVIVVLLAYALFMILLEVRTLNYIPILVGTDPALIESYEKKDKVRYITELLNGAFDYFSNTTRALFYVVIALLWFYNVYVFIIATIVITLFMVKDDFGSSSSITNF